MTTRIILFAALILATMAGSSEAGPLGLFGHNSGSCTSGTCSAPATVKESLTTQSACTATGCASCVQPFGNSEQLKNVLFPRLHAWRESHGFTFRGKCGG